MRRQDWMPVLLASLGCLCCLGFGPPVLTERDTGGMRLAPAEVRALSVWQRPPDSLAEAALLADETTGQLLMEKNTHDRRAMASTTKIMTALLTLERSRLDEEVVVSPAAAFTGGNMVGFAPGERLLVLELLYGLLLNSGNDAATVLAEHIGGSVPGFAVLMNARAQELGMQDTHFVNPHGLDAQGHYSSAYDLWLLAREALKNPVFRELVSTPSHSMGGRNYVNLNQSLLAYPGADGVKTGTSDLAGECLVASATREGHRLVAVVLNSQDRYGDARALLDYGFGGYGWAPVRPQGRALNRVAMEGQDCRLGIGTRGDILLPRWQVPLVRPFRQLDLATEGSGPAGEFRLYLADQLLWRHPLSFRCRPGGG